MSKIIYEGRACLLLTVRDVTNNKVLSEKKTVDEVKNRIFKSFTHELKNPMNCNLDLYYEFSFAVFLWVDK